MDLEIDNIELNYGSKNILSGVYIHAKEGEITGILGRNGSGKTSLFQILFGNLSPKYKSIRMDGKNISKRLFLTDSIAYLPQDPLLPKRIKAITAFKFFNADWNRFVENFTGFDPYKNHDISELSSGELRLMETYLILGQNKKIILLDEPFSFIAPIYVEKIKSIIQEIKSDKIILITDHFYNDILQLSDKMYFLNNGCSKVIKNLEDLSAEGYIPS